MSGPTRPLLRWHGGKWRLAPWIISHFPSHRTYVEPFGGAASVLLRKAPSYAEVWNDLDDELVNLFRVLRDPYRAAELIRRLQLTPFARADFRDAYRPSRSQLEKARRLIVRSFMGFGNNPTRIAPRTGFRSATSQSGSTPAKDWSTYPEALWGIVERLHGVTIECKPALSLIAGYDRDDVLIYADPPYVHATRPSFLERGARSDGYQYEMVDEEHVGLLDVLDASSAMVMLSGYENAIYADRLSSWRRVEQRAHTDGGRERTEVLWLNPALVERYGSGPLFEVAA